MKPRLTEKQWLKAKRPLELDLYRSTWQSYRKWRLFGAACSRRAILLAPDERLDELADAAERFADGLLNWGKIKVARKILAQVRRELGELFGPDEVKHDTLEALDAATRQKPVEAMVAHFKAAYAYAACKRSQRNAWEAALHKEEREQMHLARDIFGNPFRRVSFDCEWRTSNVVSLARSMYESRDFAAMPILSDALQDAGCENEDILDHCRDRNGVHVRGCWVVDLILGKS